MAYPDWVLAHKAPGTNISQIQGKYYLYQASSVWDNEKGRAKKITGKYLGRITESGLIPPRQKQGEAIETVSVKEYGASAAFSQLGGDILAKLKEIFPAYAEKLFAIAVIRAIEHCPFKRIKHFYEHSYLSEIFAGLNLSPKHISVFLRDFGNSREKIVEFMNGFVQGSRHILFDVTNIISKSEKMNINRMGYNNKQEYEPQLNLLYAFASDLHMPVYYRIIAVNTREVAAFKLSVTESQLKNIIVVADKGFGSQANFDMLEEHDLNYVVPLRRNNTLFDNGIIIKGDKAGFDGFFMFNERPIWHYTKKINGKNIIAYLDNDLKNEEEKDYLKRVEKQLEGYTKAGFLEKQYDFGTIVIKTNLNKSAEEVYCIYKERAEIEQSFDFLKNLLEQDKSYMQNEQSLETWAFVNHISLILNYKVYNILRTKKILSKYSVADFVAHLKYIFKIKVNNLWLNSEISTKTANLLNSMEIHIT